MTKYRMKPVVFEAFQWSVDKVPQWWKDKEGLTLSVHNGSAFIPTLEGIHVARSGDYIIQGIQGEIYPCKPGIFEATYEKVAPDHQEQ